jgi:hypothetical protein
VDLYHELEEKILQSQVSPQASVGSPETNFPASFLEVCKTRKLLLFGEYQALACGVFCKRLVCVPWCLSR